MSRIDLMFFSDGEGRAAFGFNVEEDQNDVNDSGADEHDEKVVAHLAFEESDESVRSTILDAIIAQHHIECELGPVEMGCTVFEKLISEIFKSGVAYGRQSAGKGG